MMDRPKLDSMLSNLNAYVAVLKGLASVSRDAFLANPDKLGNAKYHFVIAIECCIDVGNHMIASERLRIPSDNADVFTVLVEHGFCPEALHESLRAMARFRNRLVHLYWDVDGELLYGYLQERLDDFDRFAAAVSAAAR
jgi:uncharacterized protein YutE (UPF0331/DUF86 family)